MARAVLFALVFFRLFRKFRTSASHDRETAAAVKASHPPAASVGFPPQPTPVLNGWHYLVVNVRNDSSYGEGSELPSGCLIDGAVNDFTSWAAPVSHTANRWQSLLIRLLVGTSTARLRLSGLLI